MVDYFPPELSDEYDIYGKTPPRTKILRKHREKKQRDRTGSKYEEILGTYGKWRIKKKFGKPKLDIERSDKRTWITIRNMPSPTSKGKASIARRNTVGYIYDEMISKAEMTDSDHGGNGITNKRMTKRQLKLLRGSERDLKLDIASAQAAQNMIITNVPNGPPTPQPSFQVECNKRFMCLSGRTVFNCNSNRHSYDSKLDEKKKQIMDDNDEEEDKTMTSRVLFHRTLCMLIKIGISDKQGDRNPKRCPSREEFRWHEYRDVIWLELRAYHASRTTVEEDIFLCKERKEVATLLDDLMNYRFEPKRCGRYPKELQTQNGKKECSGCAFINCVACLDAQSEALKEIEELSQRLEKAESLFPSGKAFAEMYPIYRSPEFEGRVATISLWVNLTRLHRINLMLLGRFLFFLDTKNCKWNTPSEKSTTNGGSNNQTEGSNNQMEGKKSPSPNDPNNDFNIEDFDYMSNNFLLHLMKMTENEDSSPYRKYIENVLKTQALKKSLNFLEKLHVQVLNKALLTLEKPRNGDVFTNTSLSNEENELRRYGAWSPEAQAINLPSYRAAFLFLAAVPLEVIHQFMLLRLEQRPLNPSPLSVRQLMREYKEGLNIAITQRNRAENYISAIKRSTDLSIDKYVSKLKHYDECMEMFFMAYLGYIEKWALLEHVTFQKNLLEVEWDYCSEIIKCMPHRQGILEQKFCEILCAILKRIANRMMVNVEDIVGAAQDDDDVKYNILAICRELQPVLNEEREMSVKALSFCKKIFKNEVCDEAVWRVKEAIFKFKCTIPDVIERIQSLFVIVDTIIDDVERITLVNRVREILMQAYKIGFEFYREMTDFVPDQKRRRLVLTLVQFANLWMKFVVEKCERGRGMRPRWALKGLEFLCAVVDPKNTRFLTQAEFEQLKTDMDQCISHVIGTTAPSTPDSGLYSASPRSSHSGRSRGSSPSPRPAHRNKRSRRKISNEKMSSPSEDSLDSFSFDSRKLLAPQCGDATPKQDVCPQTRAKEAIELLDVEIDNSRRNARLIGKVLNKRPTSFRVRQKYVKFTWQRGIKIGQGRFGKVYTAVNNNTGEMMALKEIPIQNNDDGSFMRATDEMKVLEGISHRNLVKYYGTEIHRDEMMVFMEYCQEGTLENIIAACDGGLPELLMRRYTFQLLSGVHYLHEHGVAHRDIKPANIFMTDDWNCLKIGDFGSAAKIKAHTTVAGELKGLFGTLAYMAPEVFSAKQGHGRAADIWSVGCVVVEMASGKRPWSELDSNYQIMFKVGSGARPDPPENMIDEGVDFLRLCFKFKQYLRATAQELLNHDFVKVGGEDL
ncbi:mitogen-activated protein kinase kinase kinase 4 isoform X2 [Coccinella septempunctata]|uniref:mitogen-activated protein kinase kinase kinase 4 isoform X2 n=1 Tax=Coccinella septempunctata TaxID=41139 RepID=UPI001D069998|nr:mitogen-activated protein kinase kinase kinase 4 isoform X2 [Coccinella septempunctata]